MPRIARKAWRPIAPPDDHQNAEESDAHEEDEYLGEVQDLGDEAHSRTPRPLERARCGRAKIHAAYCSL